jgi:hypothetical protein
MVIARRGLFTLVVEAQWLYSGNQKTPLTVKVIYWYLTPVSVFTQKVKQNQVLAIEIIQYSPSLWASANHNEPKARVDLITVRNQL